LGVGRGRILIAWIFLWSWIGAAVQGFHLDPVQGPPTVSGRLDSVLRDSLRARSVDLYPLDSLRWLEKRGDWSPGERTPEVVARILSGTHRPAAGWVRIDALEGTFHRIPWWHFWAKRSWVLRGEAFRATADGIVSERISDQVDLPLGFVGTTEAETHPASSAEYRQALDTLSRDLAAQAVPFLLGQQKR